MIFTGPILTLPEPSPFISSLKIFALLGFISTLETNGVHCSYFKKTILCYQSVVCSSRVNLFRVVPKNSTIFSTRCMQRQAYSIPRRCSAR